MPFLVMCLYHCRGEHMLVCSKHRIITIKPPLTRKSIPGLSPTDPQAGTHPERMKASCPDVRGFPAPVHPERHDTGHLVVYTGKIVPAIINPACIREDSPSISPS